MGLAINYPKNQWMYIDSNGNFKPAAAYKLHIYEANTTTEQSAYTEVTATTAHSNPIVLDSEGKAAIYLDTSKPAYKFVLKDPTDTATIETIDYVNYNQPPALTAPSTSPYITASSSTALSAERTLSTGGSILATDNGANSTLQLDVNAPLLLKTGAYTVVAADRGKVVYYSGAGGVALTFPSAVGLTDGFFVYASNRSSGNITVTPDGSETVDTASTLILTPDQGVLVFSDGVNLFTLQPSLSGVLSQNLDVNGYSIVSISDGNILLTPDGTGEVIIASPLQLSTAIATDEISSIGVTATPGSIAIGEAPDNGSSKFVINAPASMAADVEVTMPATTPVEGDTLVQGATGLEFDSKKRRQISVDAASYLLDGLGLDMSADGTYKVTVKGKYGLSGTYDSDTGIIMSIRDASSVHITNNTNQTLYTYNGTSSSSKTLVASTTAFTLSQNFTYISGGLDFPWFEATLFFTTSGSTTLCLMEGKSFWAESGKNIDSRALGTSSSGTFDQIIDEIELTITGANVTFNTSNTFMSVDMEKIN